MRRWKLAAVAAGGSVALAAGMFAAFSLTARASVDTCSGASDTAGDLICVIGEQSINAPLTISVTITTTPAGRAVDLTWQTICSDASGGLGTVNQAGAPNPVVVTTVAATSGATSGTITTPLVLSLSDPTSCEAEATAEIPTSGITRGMVPTLSMEMDATQQAVTTTSPTPSPTPSAVTSSASSVTHYNQVRGFDGICLDDKGNKSTERTSVIVWGCNNTDQAQGWTYSGSELKIHGMCLNAKGSGKQGSHLILWPCTSSGNEIFSHRSNGEFVEKANGYSLCIDDPGYSTKNGTQPFMYKCNNGANQHWAKP
jgi:hypothetical protein